MFWKKFYLLCEQKNTSPSKVVSELKIATGSVTKWKNGSTPNGKTLQKLADYFDVTVDYLLGKEQKEENTLDHLNQLPSFDMTEDEREILSCYRRLSQEQKEKFRSALLSMILQG